MAFLIFCASALYIATNYWGHGLATEAASAFIKYGFDSLKLNKIVAMIDTRNDASVAIVKKVGFTLASTEIGQRSFYHFMLENTQWRKLSDE
jgi:ribosomal-protein-alanine N-acetyltransferase